MVYTQVFSNTSDLSQVSSLLQIRLLREKQDDTGTGFRKREGKANSLNMGVTVLVTTEDEIEIIKRTKTYSPLLES